MNEDTKEGDRFTFSISKKISDDQYGSVQLHASYSSSQDSPKETTEALAARVIHFTKETLRHEFSELLKRMKGPKNAN